MDQHGLKRSDLVPLLGTAERVDDILRTRRHLSLAMVQRLRPASRPACTAGFGVAAPAPDKRSGGVGIIRRAARLSSNVVCWSGALALE
jgi:hypothetical protein